MCTRKYPSPSPHQGLVFCVQNNPCNWLIFTTSRYCGKAVIGTCLLRSCWPIPLNKHNPPLEQVGKDRVISGFEDLHGWRLHCLFEQPFPLPGHPHSKKKCSDRIPCVSVCACCLLHCHWAALERAWLHLLHLLPPGICEQL